MSGALSNGDAMRRVWWIPVVGLLVALGSAFYTHGSDFSVAGLLLNGFRNITVFALVALGVSSFFESRAPEDSEHKRRWALRFRGSAIFVVLGAAVTLVGFVTAVGFGLTV
jgi:hypothetical protein